MQRISISEKFADAPGGRLRTDGDKSGEEFREDFLIPALNKLKKNEKLLVDLDGCYGFPPSFLEEIFGGLVRQFGIEKVRNYIDIKSEEEPLLLNEIDEYISDAVS